MIEVVVNGERRTVRAAGIRELLAELGYGPDRPGIAVALNAEVVPRSEWDRTRLGPGDRVEIVGAVQGG